MSLDRYGYQAGSFHSLQGGCSLSGPIAGDDAPGAVRELLNDPEVIQVVLIVSRNGPGSTPGFNAYSRLTSDEAKAETDRAEVYRQRTGG
jgi:hypothetical protein